jgi:hypothetical protein
MSRDQTAPGEGAFNLYTFGGRDRTVGVRPQTRIFWDIRACPAPRKRTFDGRAGMSKCTGLMHRSKRYL